MPPAAKSGAMKIVLIVVGVMFVFGVLSMAGMYYAAHRYIRMAEDITGIKAGDVIDSVHDAANHSRRGGKDPQRDGCALLSKDEATAILGVEVERMDGRPDEQESGEHCNYFVKPETVEKNLEEFKKSAEALKNPSNSPLQPNQLPAGAEDMVKTYTRAMSEGSGDGKTPYFGFTIERENGKLTYTAFQMARRLSAVDALSENGGQAPLTVGDQAIMGIGDAQMCVVKGHSSITLNLTQVTAGRAKGISLARKILERL